MFQIIIKLDEQRMRRNGLDIIAAWEAINDMAEETGGIELPEKGVFVTEDSSAHMYFMDLLEETDWFLKYVSVWKTDDGLLKDDVIESLREMRIKCSYQ